MIIALSGAPGAGKTTLSKYLHKHIDGSALLIADVFRIDFSCNEENLKNYFYEQIVRMATELSERGRLVIIDFAPTRKFGDFLLSEDVKVIWLDISIEDAVRRGLQRRKSSVYGEERLRIGYEQAMKGLHIGNKEIMNVDASLPTHTIAHHIADNLKLKLINNPDRDNEGNVFVD